MPFKNPFRSRDKPQPKDQYNSRSYSFHFGRSSSGRQVDDWKALQLTAVYACIRVLSETVAQLPLHVYQSTNTGKERVPNHPLYFLLHDQPNPEMTSFVFRETLMSHLLIYGNAYAQIIRNGRGEVVGLYPLLPDRMTVDRDDKNRLIYRYSCYENANPNLKKLGELVLPRENVLHIPGLGFDGLIGYSPIALAKNSLGLSLACEDFGSSFFANGATPSGVLEYPNTVKDPEKVRDAWRRAYGSGNRHKIAVLEQGMKYQSISIPNNEAQFLETRKFQVEEIARMYRVPLHMIGDLDHATFSNVEHREVQPRPVACPLGTGTTERLALRFRKGQILHQVQCRGAFAWRLCFQNAGLCDCPTKWLDVHQRHPGTGRHEPNPRSRRRKLVSGQR